MHVLDAWFASRNARDTVVKMNTGAGKTLVGLLMLQSSLNEGVGPALYLCPKDQLVEQVIARAQECNIPTVTYDGDYLPTEFTNSKAILVTHFQNFFNGMSRFGVIGGRHLPAKLGCLLVDDAHSCLALAREQSSISFPRTHNAYQQLFDLFRPVLESQSASRTVALEEGVAGTTMGVPFWAWLNSIPAVSRIIVGYRAEGVVKFPWPLLEEDLPLAHCLFTTYEVLITPYVLPVHRLPSLGDAKRRFFLSATLVDDTVLVRDFDVSPEAVLKPLEPKVLGDIGERLILAPTLVRRDLKREQLLPVIKRVAADGYNVVVLVPSTKASEFWKANGATVPKGDGEVQQVVEKLHQSRGNFVALFNRYDGIDLPDDACRLLVIDGLPLGGLSFEQYQMNVRRGSTQLLGAQAQRIEQGLGRGVRSGSDYCAVLLLGTELAEFAASPTRRDLFSVETAMQLELGVELAEALRKDSGDPLVALRTTLDYSLRQNSDWRQLHRERLSSVVPKTAGNPDAVAIVTVERQAAKEFRANDVGAAVERLRTFIAGPQGPKLDVDKGWYLQFLASFEHKIDPNRAQGTQKQAHALNSEVFKPVGGVTYPKLQGKTGVQPQRVLQWLQRRTRDYRAIPVEIEALLSNLTFGTKSHVFEQRLQDLAIWLGDQAQRPDWEFGVGPDVLWEMAGEHFLILEAKSEVQTTRETISKTEAGQLGQHIAWFKQQYGERPVTPVLLHPASRFESDAFAPEGTMVINVERLAALHDAVRKLSAALVSKAPAMWTVEEIGNLLAAHSLTSGLFRTTFLRRPLTQPPKS
jgi:hypothetical protein